MFLERSTARVINSEPLKPPNPACEICAVAQSDLIIDPSRAILNDLVNDVLKLKLGYGNELSISNDAGLLYDLDYDDNLEKKFIDLGVKSGSFLTVMDEDEESPHVNVSLAIAEQYVRSSLILCDSTLTPIKVATSRLQASPSARESRSPSKAKGRNN